MLKRKKKKIYLSLKGDVGKSVYAFSEARDEASCTQGTLGKEPSVKHKLNERKKQPACSGLHPQPQWVPENTHCLPAHPTLASGGEEWRGMNRSQDTVKQSVTGEPAYRPGNTWKGVNIQLLCRQVVQHNIGHKMQAILICSHQLMRPMIHLLQETKERFNPGCRATKTPSQQNSKCIMSFITL